MHEEFTESSDSEAKLSIQALVMWLYRDRHVYLELDDGSVYIIPREDAVSAGALLESDNLQEHVESEVIENLIESAIDPSLN